MSREQEILLTQRMFRNEVDRLLAGLEAVKDDPVRYAKACLDAQRELTNWIHGSYDK